MMLHVKHVYGPCPTALNNTLEKFELAGLYIGVCLLLDDPSFFNGKSFFLMTLSTCGVSSPSAIDTSYKNMKSNA